MTQRVDPGMQTPLAPIDGSTPKPTRRAGRSTKKRTRAKAERKPGGVRDAVRHGLAYGRNAWRVLFVVLVVQILLSMTVVLPFHAAVAGQLEHHAHAPALAGAPDAYDTSVYWAAGLDAGIWRDLAFQEKSLFEGLALTLFWVSLVAWLFGAVVSGGIAGTAVDAPGPVSVGRFFTQAGRNLGRMLRVGLVFAVAYYLVWRGVVELWGKSVEPDEHMAASEAVGWTGARMREAVLVLCFFWFRIAADLARADLVVFSRKSAVLGFLRGLGGVFRLRPVVVALLIGLPALLILLGLGFVGDLLRGEAWWILVLLFVTFQVAVLVRWFARAATLAGFARLTIARR